MPPEGLRAFDSTVTCSQCFERVWHPAKDIIPQGAPFTTLPPEFSSSLAFINLTFHLNTISTVNFRFCRSSLRRYFPIKLEMNTQGCGVQVPYESEHDCISFCMSFKNFESSYPYPCLYKMTAHRFISNASQKIVLSSFRLSIRSRIMIHIDMLAL